MGRSDVRDDQAWIDAMTAALEEFRKWNPDVTVNSVLTFLQIAKKPGITQKEILRRLGMADSGTSRTTAALSKYGDRGRAGWGVVDLEENPDDRREKLLFLNKKGQLVLDAVRRSIEFERR